MLCVPTYVAESSIHGVGLFTPAAIERGTTIWEFTPGVDWEIRPAELEAFPEPYRSRLFSFSYLDERGLYVLCGDNARFMNHSDTPSCDDSGEKTVACRMIGAGEELTCDYRLFDQTTRMYGLGATTHAGTTSDVA